MIYAYYYNENGRINKIKQPDWDINYPDGDFYEIEDDFDSRHIQVTQMSNPHIYAEAGITEQDINDYEFANAVPAADFSIDPNTGVSSTDVQNALDEMYNNIDEYGYKFTLPNNVEFRGLGELFDKSEPKQCTCDSRDLFNFGCKCGGV